MRKIVLISISSLIFMTGCFRTANGVSPRFWKNRAVHIGVGIRVLPPHIDVNRKDLYREMLLHNDFPTFTENEKYIIQKFVIEEFNDVVSDFVRELNRCGFQAKKISDFVIPKSERKTEVDLTSIANEAKVDILILFNVHSLGILNHYDRKNNLIQSSAKLGVYGYMSEMKNGKMKAGFFKQHLWTMFFSEENGTIPIEGDWRQPPDYPKLKSALKEAITKAKVFFIEDFFKREE
ncbi:MAG: hypothetical protein ACKVQC_06075 [Elusimicrobiota bacterium]